MSNNKKYSICGSRIGDGKIDFRQKIRLPLEIGDFNIFFEQFLLQTSIQQQ
jgi:hypothetical protein